jgi:hypothetical protein
MNSTADPATQVALWKRARAMCARAIEAIGEPQALAVRGSLTRAVKHDIAGWLARLESIVRKLLLGLAAALLEDEGRPCLQVGVRGLRPHAAPVSQADAPQARPETARSTLDRSAPQTWPARFALAPPCDPHAVPNARAPRVRALWGETAAPPPIPAPTPKHFSDPALRFAFRLEALKRVLADPIPHARRLARILRRLVRRYPHAAERYAITPARPYAADPGDPRLIVDAISAAMRGAPLITADTS